MKAALLIMALAVLCAARATAPNLITIDVHDADISDVIALLAAQSGENIVPDDSMKPERITLHLHDVTFGRALAVLVSAHDLQVHREGNVLIVGSADTMNRRYDESKANVGAQTVVLQLEHANPDDVAKEIVSALPLGTIIVPDRRTSAVVITGSGDTVARARRLIAALDAPTIGAGSGSETRSYSLKYVKADDAIKQLKILAPEGTYVADDEHNGVIVDGSDGVQSTVATLFATLDRPSPQVMFEVKVADVTPQNDSSNFGLEFGGTNLQGTTTLGSTAYAFAGGSVPVNVTLNALITQGRAQILATPKLVTLNNKEADLLIGETYPIVFNTSVLGGQNVQFVDIGVKLRLTPTIGDDGVVTAELHPEYSEIEGLTDTGYPIITNRKIDSTLRVNDSQTIVLGGLMRDVTSETITKVPGLADIPILGKFFQNKETSHERDEIVFLITPHVIYPKETPGNR
ncbi:MAG TPA: secretin N-terminal domain-containing protein [Candidatus Baltobacteraceae bacterium]|nr:secretin N-terminal domain-containing protein [Candidatus Baltobacteraceae bacterium]